MEKEKGKRGSRERVNEAEGRKEPLTANLFARKIMVEWRSQRRDKVVPGTKQQVALC